MYPGQFRPGIDAWPGGPPIAAIVAQQGPGFIPGRAAERVVLPEDRARWKLISEARTEALRAIEAAPSVWERLILALSSDFEIFRHKWEAYVTLELRSVSGSARLMWEAPGKAWATPAELWKRMDSHVGQPAHLNTAESQEFARWFADEAGRRGVRPSTTLAWPEPRRNWRGRFTGAGQPEYTRGARTPAWEMLYGQSTRGAWRASYITVDGRLWVQERIVDSGRGLQPERGLDAVSLVHAGRLLGLPHSPAANAEVPRLFTGTTSNQGPEYVG